MRRLKYDPVDIAYIWQRVSPTLHDTHAEYLTTWEPPGSTYRPISIPLPSVHSGESWRLGLIVLAPDGPSTPSLSSFCCSDPGIVPVWSGPIAITAPDFKNSSIGPIRGKPPKTKRKADETSGSKQDRIHREWTAGDGIIKIIEQTSFDLDKVSLCHRPMPIGTENLGLWASSVVMALAASRRADIVTHERSHRACTEYPAAAQGGAPPRIRNRYARCL